MKHEEHCDVHFNFNSDCSGDVLVRCSDSMRHTSVHGDALLAFAAERIRERLLIRVEQATQEQLLSGRW